MKDYRNNKDYENAFYIDNKSSIPPLCVRIGAM